MDGILSWPTESVIKGSDGSRGSCWDVREIRYASCDSDSCSSNIWYKGDYNLKRLASAIRLLARVTLDRMCASDCPLRAAVRLVPNVVETMMECRVVPWVKRCQWGIFAALHL